MFFIGQNLKHNYMTYSFLLINSRYLVFEVSEAVVQVSSRSEVFCTKVIRKNFAKFAGKHLCQNLFFNKVADLRFVTLLKKRRRHRCFSADFTKFIRAPFFTKHLQWLLLKIISNIFTAKIFRIILNGKTLLHSELSWIFWLRSDGAKNSLENNASYSLINSAVYKRSVDRRNPEGKGEQTTEHKCKAGNKLSFRNKK